MFEHPDNVRKLQIQDLATEMGIFFNDEEIPEQKLDKLYNYICDYEDGDKALNERVKHPYTNKDINPPRSNYNFSSNLEDRKVKVIVDDFNKFFIEPIKPTPSACSNDALNECLIDNIDDIMMLI